MSLWSRLRHGFHTWKWERRLGISTTGSVEPQPGGDGSGYAPLEYEFLEWALPAIPYPAEEVVFLDYGAGKGRVMAAAAAYPFRKVLGVEVSEELCAMARANLAGMKRRRAGEIEVHSGDAADYAVPADVNVFFFFHPFGGETLARVLERMRLSYWDRPRDLLAIVFNPAEFDRYAPQHPWLTRVDQTPFCAWYRAL